MIIKNLKRAGKQEAGGYYYVEFYLYIDCDAIMYDAV